MTWLLCRVSAQMCSEAFMSVMAALVPHYIVGIALGSGVFGMFMLCQGFFIVRDDIPNYWIWGLVAASVRVSVALSSPYPPSLALCLHFSPLPGLATRSLPLLVTVVVHAGAAWVQCVMQLLPGVSHVLVPRVPVQRV
jgi:hypothetical protein